MRCRGKSPPHGPGDSHAGVRSARRAKHVLVLHSGGIDSTACLAFYLQQGFAVEALFVDYGQAAARRERKAATAISTHYNIRLRPVECAGFQGLGSGYILGRNMFLAGCALMAYPYPAGIIAMGIHAGTSYADCSQLFVEQLQAICDTYAGGAIVLGVPFLEWSKRDMVDYCRMHEVPLQLTYSCELGQDQPCGKCASCRDLEALHVCAD